MSVSATPPPENRLAGATSPYLLQHKNNPVDWWPWGPEALAEAKRANKPILLSIGYAACHWCHVMAHESFEDPAAAAVMNELFVSIKVDREERPDIDEIYMSALQHLGEQGGWPLTMFLTAAGEPFWGGTYFPNTARYGRPAFVDVLREVARVYREEPDKIEVNRKSLAAQLAARAKAQGKITLGRAELDDIAERTGSLMDPVNGGVRGAPKFPQCAILEFLWRAGERTGEERYFAIVSTTLDRMSEGGIYDHLGGGYSRYSVDERWLVPHFEKMLYDNAQILELLALAFARTGRALFRDRADETVAWLAREMLTSEGGFASSIDADSEGEEGKFYVWSLDEVKAVLGDVDAAFFAVPYGLSAEGNFEGRNILNRLNHLPRTQDSEDRLKNLRAKLLAARARCVRPGLDDKVLADWNGLMIAALANAGALFGEEKWIDPGARAFRFVAEKMSRGDRLGHSWREERLLFPGLSSDYAAMIRAAIALHQATGEQGYLDQAVKWTAALEAHHADSETGGYFLTADDAEGLIVRPAQTRDDATPNPNAVMAQNLIRLSVLTGEDRYRERADRLFEGLLPLAAENLFGHMALLSALDLRLRHREIVAVGKRASEFAEAALRLPFLDRTVLRVSDVEKLPAHHPARAMAASAPEAGAAFICQGETCSLPITEPDKLSGSAPA
ncbi:MAG TPA: thioredoxin domain-containing protein [Xanthobacteraceae bacterium]|nr:thioredoxin domain-containing protein [Xanthobacteraceae bacterium]